MPTTLIMGQRDKTAPGKPFASPENQKKLGDYPKLGHLPFVEDFEGFMKLFVAEI